MLSGSVTGFGFPRESFHHAKENRKPSRGRRIGIRINHNSDTFLSELFLLIPRHENTSDVYAKIIKRKKVFKGKGTREGKPINFVRGFSKPLHDQNALIIYALRYVNVPNLRIFHPFRTCARQNRFFSSNFFHRQREGGGRRARENLML